MNTVNLLLIGLGPHSKRIYFPLIEAFSCQGVKLIAFVDLKEKQEDIISYLSEKSIKPIPVYIYPHQQTYHKLHPEIELKLNRLVRDHKIKGIIIASEPLVHIMYAKWALSQGLSVLMDKPISTHFNISTDSAAAKQLLGDYHDLKLLYEHAIRKNPSVIFSVMAQRRYQTSFNLLRHHISDCFAKTNCPITNVHTFHSDGQWRMPTEIVEQLYHPYMQGYGKCSHSGYHYYDIIPFLLQGALGGDKYYDNVDIFTTVTRPLDFLEQLSLKDYERLFGRNLFGKHNKYTENELSELMKNYGEIDAFSNICFKKSDKVITIVSINLAHNGFSTRDWVTAASRDLYQGNGRVGHEVHILQQGPFQTLHFHSYKSKENVDEPNQVGGKQHLEIFIFKNHKMIGGQPVTRITINDLIEMEGGDRGLLGKAKAKVFVEYIKAIRGYIPRTSVISEFIKQEHAVILTSGIYQSMIAQIRSKNPLINLKIHLKE
jgi:hypothetical protein